MSSRRNPDRTVAFDCDRCGTTHESGAALFPNALANLRKAGWKATRASASAPWRHSCVPCQKGTDQQEIDYGQH